MKRILIGLVIGLLLLEAGRRLHSPSDEAAAAGAAAYREGDFATAEARFHEAERDATDKAPAAYNRAAALYKLRRFDDADHSYQRSADDEALHAARTDYDRGNCSFGEARKDEGSADPEGLQRAAHQYETCLAREGSTSEAGSLFDDARHNLELARLILSEFAEANKPTAEAEKPEPEKPEAAKDDPLAPSNAAHPPEGENGQPKPDAAKGEPKEPKPSETLAKNDSPAEPHPCKDCERGGCPKCKKKPGKGPGPNEAPRKGDGPKPNPGKADNGKAPGQGKGPTETPHTDPGGGPKGKPGEGGKPKPNEQNGVGDAKEPGTGPADPNAKSTKKSPPSSEGKMVGPDGVTYERDLKGDKPSKGGKNGGGDEASEEMKDPKPGGKNGAPHGAPGDSQQPRDSKDQTPPADVDKLFKPGTPRPNDRNDPGQGGTSSGLGRYGSGQNSPDAEETDGNGDPRERAAARRLRQAVQRIEKSRDARPAPSGAGKGEVPDSDRRRDW